MGDSVEVQGSLGELLPFAMVMCPGVLQVQSFVESSDRQNPPGYPWGTAASQAMATRLSSPGNAAYNELLLSEIKLTLFRNRRGVQMLLS